MIAELRQVVAAAIEDRCPAGVTVAAAAPDALVPPGVAVDLESISPSSDTPILETVTLSVTVLPYGELTNSAHADERDRLVEAVTAALRGLKLEGGALAEPWRGDLRDVTVGGVAHRAVVFSVPVTLTTPCD